MCVACGPLMDAINSNFIKPSRRLFLKGSSATAIAAGFGASINGLICSEVMAQSERWSPEPVPNHSPGHKNF